MMRSDTAIAQGSCTRRPYGECSSTRQSPCSSSQRSTTSVLSSGIVPVAARCARTSSTRLRCASSSRPSAAKRSRTATATPKAPSSVSASFPSMPPAIARRNAPRMRPVSAGRPAPSPCQNGSRADLPGAGSTITRSRVISCMRHELVPSVMMSPTRDSYTISSSSSPTRRRPSLPPPSGSTTENMPRSGMVPADMTAWRCEPGRAFNRPFSRSHTMRGENSARSDVANRPASMSSTASNARRGSSA